MRSMTIPRTGLILSLGFIGCNDATNTAPMDPILIVAHAASDAQPNSEGGGIFVTIQARGGKTLTLRTRNGVHFTTGQDKPRRASCVPLARDSDKLAYLRLTVIPDDEECSLDVQLLEEALEEAKDPSGDSICESPGSVVLSHIEKIAAAPANTTENASNNASSSGGSGGMGGTSDPMGSSSSASGGGNKMGGMGGNGGGGT